MTLIHFHSNLIRLSKVLSRNLLPKRDYFSKHCIKFYSVLVKEQPESSLLFHRKFVRSKHLLNSQINVMASQVSNLSDQASDPKPDDKQSNSNASKLKILVRDYGTAALVFHVTISLFSLGLCYLLISTSVPMDKVFAYFGFDQKLGNLNTAATTSTNFIVAYTFHKSLAPIRLGITAASVPFVVRFLRSKNILKPTKKQ